MAFAQWRVGFGVELAKHGRKYFSAPFSPYL